MEDWQRNHIRENLPKLLNYTTVDSSLTSRLLADGVLGESDLSYLNAIPNRKELAAKFYEIIQTRTKSYNLLKQSLAETNQTGAYAILNSCNEQNILTPFKNCGTISYGKELLGRGCHNTNVFKGKFENRDVAVKIVNTQYIVVPKALREVGVMMSLDWHENVVRYFRTEITEDYVLIAMELCDTNLHDWVVKPKTVDIDVLEVLRQTTQGVAHLHGNRIVHRDLKPANILLVRHPVGVVRVKISDFGMSNNIPDGKSRLTVHSSGMGTEGWMAPEVVEYLLNLDSDNSVLRVGFASDIFSLGCIFYFVMTSGAHPFGDHIRRQGNILDKKFELSEEKIRTPAPNNIIVSDFIALIREMISHNDKQRPSALGVLSRLVDISNSNPPDEAESTFESPPSVSHIRSTSPDCVEPDDVHSLDSPSAEVDRLASELEVFAVPPSKELEVPTQVSGWSSLPLSDSGPSPDMQTALDSSPVDKLAPVEQQDWGAERDLAEDAYWKKIQQNTFTRWVNEHLKTVHQNVQDLATDFSDGLRLISLIEVLSGRKLPRHNKRPNFVSQKLENVSVALRFLELDEGIRIVNIDSSDIVECKLKLILGLMWTLILHFSIDMPEWEEGEEETDKRGSKATPKQKLLQWVQSKLNDDLHITNFTTNWNNGIAVGALVDAVAPGLCPNWRYWYPSNALQNAELAMGLAEKWLNIPQLIKPEEIINPNMDELSMMTYLAQYPSAKLRSGAPLRQRYT